MTSPVAGTVLTRFVEGGEYVQPGSPLFKVAGLDTLVFHREVLETLKREIAALKAHAADGRASVDVKSFKDTYGVTRKYAIPLLEFLDRERVTRRMGEARVVL